MNTMTAFPILPLRPIISHYAGFHCEGLEPGSMRALPSRHATIIISLDQATDCGSMGSFESFLAGLNDQAQTVYHGNKVHGLHVFLNPLGIESLFGIPASELRGGSIELELLLGTQAINLREQLQEATSWQQRFQILDRAFYKILQPNQCKPQIIKSLEYLVKSRGSLNINQLSTHLGWNRRHFSQQFRQHLGITPKTFARIIRFEQACALIRVSNMPIVDIAASVGFYDHAHMNREWQSLAGCTPTTWIREELPFVQDYELAALDNAVSIS